MQAARILADWNIHHEQLRGFPTEETKAFLSWRDDVVTMLARRAWITPDHLITRITQAITDGELPAPERLCVLPSNVPTRAQIGLLEALQQTARALQGLRFQPLGRVTTSYDLQLFKTNMPRPPIGPCISHNTKA